MVHPVVGGRIEHQLYPARQPPDGLRMYPELVNEADSLHAHDHYGVEAQQRHPCPEQEGAGKIAGPGLAQGGGQVVFAGGVVDHVRGPEKAHAMAYAVNQ